MGQRLNLSGGLPAFTQSATLGGVQYRLRFVWNERLAGWYMDVSSQDGTQLVGGVRLCAGYSPLHGLRPEGVPAGYFLVTGPDEYTMEQLGTDLLVTFVEVSEIDAQAPAEDPETAIRILVN